MAKFKNPTALTTPCANCPFRKDIPAFLRKGRAEEIVGSICRGEEFPCHKTILYGEDDDGNSIASYTPSTQYCAGSLILLEKEGMAENNAWLRLSRAKGWGYDPSKLDMKAPVFDSMQDFINAQEES